MVGEAVPFFIVTLLLTWVAPGWRWLLGVLVMAFAAVGVWLAALPNPPPGEESQGEFLLAGFLLIQAFAIASGAVIGGVGRGIALLLRRQGFPLGWRVGAQVAPLALVAVVAIGVPAWLDRSPSQGCKTSVFDVRLDEDRFHLPAAALFGANVMKREYADAVGLSFNDQRDLNRFCAKPTPVALGAITVNFRLLTMAPSEYTHLAVDADVQAVRERLCDFGELTAAVCDTPLNELPTFATFARAWHPQHCEISLAATDVCTFGLLWYDLHGEVLPDTNRYGALGEGTTRTTHAERMVAFTRFDITDANPAQGWVSVRSYFRAEIPELRDAEGRPLVFSCDHWQQARAEGEAVRCEIVYRFSSHLILSYEFEAPPEAVVDRAPRIDANMRAIIAGLRAPLSP